MGCHVVHRYARGAHAQHARAQAAGRQLQQLLQHLADLLAVPAADFQVLKIPEGITTQQALLLTDNLATGWAADKKLEERRARL